MHVVKFYNCLDVWWYYLIFISSSSLSFWLNGFNQWNPARHSVSSSFNLTQARPHTGFDVHRAITLVGLWADLHLLDDELKEAMLLLQHAWHLFHPGDEDISSCSSVILSEFDTSKWFHVLIIEKDIVSHIFLCHRLYFFLSTRGRSRIKKYIYFLHTV